MPAPTNEQLPVQDDGHSGYRVAVAPGMTRFARVNSSDFNNSDSVPDDTDVGESAISGELSGQGVETPSEMEDALQPLTPKTPLQAFHLARINATVYGTWEICWFKRCRRKKKCLGGPRGTFRQFGKPLCEVNGDVGGDDGR